MFFIFLISHLSYLRARDGMNSSFCTSRALISYISCCFEWWWVCPSCCFLFFLCTYLHLYISRWIMILFIIWKYLANFLPYPFVRCDCANCQEKSFWWDMLWVGTRLRWETARFLWLINSFYSFDFPLLSFEFINYNIEARRVKKKKKFISVNFSWPKNLMIQELMSESGDEIL